jgi:hypothetical protein
MDPKLAAKLRILADAAKYDASCASSGAPRRSGGAKGLGSTTGNGICHAYSSGNTVLSTTTTPTSLSPATRSHAAARSCPAGGPYRDIGRARCAHPELLRWRPCAKVLR